MIQPGKGVRKDFPILHQMINNKPLIYLDNAATTQKPKAVIQAVSDFYMTDNANVHRGVHSLSERATSRYEETRAKIQLFINAKNKREIIFCKGATEAINMVAHSFLAPRLKKGDEIIITEMEHHSNLIPWQILCQKTGAKLKITPINDNGELDLEKMGSLFTKQTKFLSVSHISNILGIVNPIKKITTMAHAYNVPVLVDGAQVAPHHEIDVMALDSDFYVFSGHKMYGPTGTGILYGKSQYLEAMIPYQTGGEMVVNVTLDDAEYDVIPHKFEAGTQNIAGVIGLGAAIDYLNSIGINNIKRHEQKCTKYLLDKIKTIPGIKILGSSNKKIGIISFLLDKVHPHDVGSILNNDGIAIRSGHLCSIPVMNHYLIPAASRVSLGLYNTIEEIDEFIKSLGQVTSILGL